MSRVRLSGMAAPVEDRTSVARLLMDGKAHTLDRLKPLVRSAIILDQIRFSVCEWQSDPEELIGRIGRSFPRRLVIVRSSASSEDQWTGSQAGRFRSVLDVCAHNPLEVRRAVDTVVASLRTEAAGTAAQDHVFVQEQVTDIRASGVLFTRHLETRAPYFVINIDSESRRTDVVTSGRAGRLTKIVVHREADQSALEPDVRRLVEAGDELESLTFHDALDVEFAFDRSDRLFLFQIRALATPPEGTRYVMADQDLSEELQRVRDCVGQLAGPHATLEGRDTVLGVMPDWNPVEMLGATPRPLALSLYQTLIGDSVWAEARHEMGYRDARPEPLVVSLAGRPYVDVRASLNSLLPRSLEMALARSLIDCQIAKLRDKPELHDKIEFHVATTCLAFDFDENIPTLAAMGLEEHDIDQFRSALLALTDTMLLGTVAPLEDQLARLEELGRRRRSIGDRLPVGPEGLARAVMCLIEDGKRFGTLPFAILARRAFVSLTLLRSLARIGIITPDELEALYRCIPTVASDLARDFAGHARGRMSTDEFLTKYGHLRPSTYDITSRNYSAAPELYLACPDGVPAEEEGAADLGLARALFEAKRDQIATLMHQRGFRAGPEQLRDFILRSIPERERAKFEFTKNVSLVLELVAQLGKHFDLSREDMSFLPLDRIIRHSTDSASAAERTECRRDVEFFKKRWNLTCALQLPHLIRSVGETEVFEVHEWIPNFVTSKRVLAPVVYLEAASSMRLRGKIVLIESADPGYDWIFAHGIVGLVTQYGGVASHMAIRAAERGLPAAIGCGEIIFSRVRRSQLIELDGSAQTIRSIR